MNFIKINILIKNKSLFKDYFNFRFVLLVIIIIKIIKFIYASNNKSFGYPIKIQMLKQWTVQLIIYIQVLEIKNK